MVELSEKSQFEAAIQASLQDCQVPTKKTTKYKLIFSDSDDDDDNDCVSFKSGGDSDMDDTDGGCIGIAHTVDVAGDADDPASTSFKWPLTTDSPAKPISLTVSSSDVNAKPIIDGHGACTSPLDGDKNSQLQRAGRNRKRESSPSSSQGLPRKVLRFNTTRDCDEGYCPMKRSQTNFLNSDPVKQQSSKKNKRSKHIVADGTHPQQTSKSDTVTVEEQLEIGAVQKEEVSHILFRLPDGSRLQKAFICSHPIKVNISIWILDHKTSCLSN